METKLDPAATIIDMCGGIDAVAEIVDVNRSTVYRWMQPHLDEDGNPHPRGGTGGAVPDRHLPELVKAKPAIGLMTLAEFVANFGKPQNGAK